MDAPPVNVNAAVPPPTKGPPTMMIVGGVVLLLVIIIVVVLFTRPSPEPAPVPTPSAPNTSAVSSPAPATVPVGSSPTSQLGKEVVGPTAAMTPNQQMAAKDAQAMQRATANAGMTHIQLEDRQVQAQRDAGKSVDIRKNMNF
jgi:hypothetical protein